MNEFATFVAAVSRRMGRRKPAIFVMEDPITYTDMPGLYTAADAVVMPSRGEGWGLTALEAMSTSAYRCGVAVCLRATRASGNRHVILSDFVKFYSPVFWVCAGAGRPVIATNFSGTADFLAEGTALGIPVSALEPIGLSPDAGDEEEDANGPVDEGEGATT